MQLKGYKTMKKSTLTETVKRLRKQYGLTQEQLALKSGGGLNFIREGHRQTRQGEPGTTFVQL